VTTYQRNPTRSVSPVCVPPPPPPAPAPAPVPPSASRTFRRRRLLFRFPIIGRMARNPRVAGRTGPRTGSPNNPLFRKSFEEARRTRSSDRGETFRWKADSRPGRWIRPGNEQVRASGQGRGRDEERQRINDTRHASEIRREGRGEGRTGGASRRGMRFAGSRGNLRRGASTRQ